MPRRNLSRPDSLPSALDTSRLRVVFKFFFHPRTIGGQEAMFWSRPRRVVCFNDIRRYSDSKLDCRAPSRLCALRRDYYADNFPRIKPPIEWFRRDTSPLYLSQSVSIRMSLFECENVRQIDCYVAVGGLSERDDLALNARRDFMLSKCHWRFYSGKFSISL